MGQQLPPPFGAQAGHPGQDGLQGQFPGLFPVKADGKPVGFVPEAHEQEQGRGIGREKQRVFSAREVEAVPDRPAAGQDPGFGQGDDRQFPVQSQIFRVFSGRR